LGHTQGWNCATGWLTHLLGHTHGWNWATVFGAGAACVIATVKIKVNIFFLRAVCLVEIWFMTTTTV
jgi:hypothetical protein